jgi:hypothetical protein
LFVAIIWYYNNKALINNERFRILTNETKSTLIIKSVIENDFGYYVCKAMNDAGEITTRAKLIEKTSAFFLTNEEIEEKRKKVEDKMAKKSSKTSRRSSKSEMKSYENNDVNIEATVKTGSKKSSLKTKSSTSVDVQASFKAKSFKPVADIKPVVEFSSSLQISRKEDIIVQEIEETIITEVERRTCSKTFAFNDLKDISDLKNSDNVNQFMKKIEHKNFNNGIEPVRELATIAFMIEKGLSISEINKLYHSDLFPALQTTEAQFALVQLLERHGYDQLVSEVLSEKCEKDIDEKYVATAGFTAFMKMIETKHAKVEDIILKLSPEDFVSRDWRNESSEV